MKLSSKSLAFLAWGVAWWSLPYACIKYGGFASNFIGTAICVAAGATWAAYAYLKEYDV